MGLESNVSGNCDLDFSTVNNFRLLHTISNQNLADYRLLYTGQTFEQGSNLGVTIPCTSPATDLDFRLTGWSLAGFDGFIELIPTQQTKFKWLRKMHTTHSETQTVSNL